MTVVGVRAGGFLHGGSRWTGPSQRLEVGAWECLPLQGNDDISYKT